MSTPCTTYLVLPCPPSYGPVETSQQRIVSRRARCPLGLADYRHAPDGWAEAGLVNAYEMYADRPDETSWGADPFDILAEREEEAGMPLIDMPDNDD